MRKNMGAETPRLIFLQRKLSDTLNLKDKLMTVIKFWHFKMFSGSFVHNALKITKLLKTNKTTPPPLTDIQLFYHFLLKRYLLH